MTDTKELDDLERTLRPLRVLFSLGCFAIALMIGTVFFPLVGIFVLISLKVFGILGPGPISYIINAILKVIVYGALMGPLLLVPFIREDVFLIVRLIQGKLKTRSFAVLGVFAALALLVLGMLYGIFFT